METCRHILWASALPPHASITSAQSLRGADLPDGEIEAAAERFAESDLARCCLQIEPGGGQYPQIVELGGHRECDIRDGRRASIANISDVSNLAQADRRQCGHR